MDQYSNLRVIGPIRSVPGGIAFNPPSPDNIIHDCQGSGQQVLADWLRYGAKEVFDI